MTEPPPRSTSPSHGGSELSISNEFAHVIVRKVHTRNGERLEIESPHFGTSVRLDALQLEGISWQPTEVFSGFLQGSRGPLRGEVDVVGLSPSPQQKENDEVEPPFQASD
ncbi:hypothetical protein ACLMAL_28560 [Nocardia sp. CWNU-33]|uniref:hypothetical protein n=1 Tax=Nocardia sp. CWNU-33 TaxID=3392117 RepID=UPI00398F09DB